MLEVRLLGPLAVLRDGVPVTIAGRRAQSLLAILALTPRRAISAETLAERIWGPTTPADPVGALHTTVWRLRQVLGANTIKATSQGYQLEVELNQVDALAFARLTEPVVGESPAQERERIQRALALWTGEPFGACGDWLIAYEAPRLTELWLSALERRIDLDLVMGEAGSIIAELQELTLRYPLRESLAVKLLLALDRAGRTAEAVEQYGVIRERIAGELGVEPGPELRQVFDDLLSGASARPPAITNVPQQLPPEIPRFTGRADLLSALDGQLSRLGSAASPTISVVLHGPAGVGKTSLALRWAHAARHRFPDGQLFINLRGYGPGEPTDPAIALEDLLISAGAPADTIPSGVDARSALLRTVLTGRQMLLVADNARSADQVRPLLPGAGAFVLITSRNRLRSLVARDGAEQVAIAEMAPQEARELLSRTIGTAEAIPDPLLDQLAGQCGRLPLALAIAAEQVTRRPGTNVARLVADLRKLSERLDALETGDDLTTSMRAVLSWSYRTLDPGTARFFRLLGLYPASAFGTAAAAALSGVTCDEAQRMLDRLADLHLMNEIAPGRFQMHDLLRAYAAELVAAAEEETDRSQAEARLLDWMAHTVLATRLAQGLPQRFGYVGEPMRGIEALHFSDRDEASAWMNLEWRNLICAVYNGAAQGHQAPAVRLALLLWDHLELRSALEEATALQQLAVSCAEALDEPLLLAIAANQLGTSYGRSGKLVEAHEQFQRSLAVFESLDNTDGIAMVRCNLGLLCRLMGDHEESLEQFALALRCSMANNDEDQMAATHNNMAMTLIVMGRHDEAVAAASTALTLHRKLDDRRGTAYALDTLAHAQQKLGQLADAAESFEEAIRLIAEHGNTAVQAEALVRLGHVYRASGRPADAAQAWQQALAMMRRLGTAHVDVDIVELRELLRSLSKGDS